MRTIRQALTRISLLLVLAAGAAVALPGCERDNNAGNKLEEAAEDVGEAAEEAGEELDKRL
jgi:hypothetical protein